jgi:hypothetical protein
MRVAYLFAETCPNYDLDLKLFQRMTPDELKSLNTLVRTGIWGLYEGIPPGRGSRNHIQQRLVDIFYSGKGNIFRVNDQLIKAIKTANIYTIQFTSLRRLLVLALDKRLEDQENYLGFMQILTSIQVHRQVFGWCSPRYQVEGGKIFALYSEPANDEEIADEIIEWWKEEARSLNDIHLTTALSKRNIGDRYTIFDAQEDPENEMAIQIAIQQLGDEWEVQSERTLYALQDRVPDALEEFLATTEVLSKSELSPADGAQIAVNLRRTLEHLTRFVCPVEGKEKPGWVKQQWHKYRSRNEEKLDKYGDLLAFEALSANEKIGKLEAMYQMGNKGVHEDWDPQVFRGIVLRLLLLMDAVISLEPGRRVVRLDRTLFDQHMIDD